MGLSMLAEGGMMATATVSIRKHWQRKDAMRGERGRGRRLRPGLVLVDVSETNSLAETLAAFAMAGADMTQMRRTGQPPSLDQGARPLASILRKAIFASRLS